MSEARILIKWKAFFLPWKHYCKTARVNDIRRRFDGFMERVNRVELHVSTHASPSVIAGYK